MTFWEFMWLMRGYLWMFLIYGVAIILAEQGIYNPWNETKSTKYRVTWAIIGIIAIWFLFTRWNLISYRWNEFNTYFNYWKMGILNY